MSTIAITARRLGMRWKDFRPVDGVMRAEGNGHIMTATIVRSLGILLNYSPTKSFTTDIAPETYVPSSESDDLGFEVVNTFLLHAIFPIQQLAIGTQRDIVTTFEILDDSGVLSSSLERVLHKKPDCDLPMADLVAMKMDIVRLKATAFTQLPAPNAHMHGFSQSTRGRHNFCVCLQNIIGKESYSKGAQAHASHVRN